MKTKKILAKNKVKILSVSMIVILAVGTIGYVLLFYPSSKQSQLIYHHSFTGTATITYDSVVINEPTSFEFENKNNIYPSTFWFQRENGINYHNAATMLASVITDSMNEEQKSIAIWKFVARSGFHYSYDYNHHLQDHVDPISLVTFPYFLCGEKAGIIVNLAMLSGSPARAIGLDGHVVAEIKYAGAWHMFDADENCIFRNPQGQIVAVEDLHRHPDWVAEGHIEYALKDNFHGFTHYQKYIEHYTDNWIDTTSRIANYTFPDNAITLYPNDKVSFELSPTPWWRTIFHPRFLFFTKGILTRKLNAAQANVQVKDRVVIFNESFPYYLKTLKVSSTAPLHTKVYFQYNNRETLQTEKKLLGTLNGKNTLLQTCKAPIESDIYYSYQLIFQNLSAAQLGEIQVQHTFEFNSLTFPLNHAGNKIMTMDTTWQKNLSFKINTLR